jgi:hypothetical protein
MAEEWSPKDPSEVLEYGFRTSVLLREGEEITNSTWTVEDGLGKGNHGVLNGDVYVVLIGGDDGSSYDVRCDFETNQNRKLAAASRLDVVKKRG